MDITLLNGQASWGNNDILIDGGITRVGVTNTKDLYSGTDCIAFIGHGYNSGSPTAGTWKIKVKFYHNNTEYWVRGYCNADGSGTHPTDDSGNILNGSGLYNATLQSSEVVNYMAGSYYANGSSRSVKNYFYINLSHLLSVSGLTPASMVPERVDFTFYTKGLSDSSWMSTTDTVYMYGEDNEYPKITYSYTGADLKNNKYYDNISTMTLTVTVTESMTTGAMYSHRMSRSSYETCILNTVTVNGGKELQDVLKFVPSEFSNAIATKTKTFTLTTFNDSIYINSDNGYTSGYASFDISYFPYIKPSCYETNAYRIGSDYGTVRMEAVGTYVDETEFPVTFQYKWRLQGGTWPEAWTTIGTASAGTIGPITRTLDFTSALANGNVEILLNITDTIASNTFTIYVQSPAIFNWSSQDFQFTVPVYINTNETPIMIGEVSLADYIRSVQ